MVDFLCIVGVICFFVLMVYLQDKQNKKDCINAVFEDFNSKVKPMERQAIVKELCISSAKHISACSGKLNAVEQVIYTAELAMHIFALFLANRFVEFKTVDEKQSYLKGLELNTYAVLFKTFLNPLIKECLEQNELDTEIMKTILIARASFILQEKDFVTRNFNFQNLCNLEINYEDENIFYNGKLENLRIVPGNPLNMLILPSAYKNGLVDKFLEKFKNAV